MPWQYFATLKGPRGDEVKNPRIVNDDLLVDEVNRVGSSPVTTTRNLGNVRGAGFSNPRLQGNDLLVDRTFDGVTTTLNVGNVRGAQGLPGTNATPADAAVAGYVSTAGSSETKTALDVRYASRRVVDTASKQSTLMGIFLRRLAYNESVTITCMGDSTTAGYDIVSADKVTAPRTASNGAVDNFTKSPTPWPAVLSTRLNDAFRSTVTVINRGFSGDTVALAYDHWNASHAGHVTTIQFGINDNNVVGDLQAFIDGYEQLILREVNDYNAAVVILTPIKQLNAAGGKPGIEVYRNALYSLAMKYGIPIVDTEPFFAGYDNRTHSDSVHLNTFGNNIMGSRLAAAFIGMGPQEPSRVMHGSKLSVRPYLDNCVQGDANSMIQYNAATDFTPSDGSSDGVGGIDMRLGGGPSLGTVTYSFYTETPDLIVIPQFHVESGGALQIQLDYNIQQGDAVNDYMVGDTPSLTARAPGQIQKTSGGSPITQNGHATGVDFIRIVNPGWHTLRCWGGASGSTARVFLRGLQFMDMTSFKVAQQLGL